MKKNPPYLKNFCAIPRQLPICTIYAGPFAWAGAKEHPDYSRSTMLVLPPDELPSAYRWEFLDGWIVDVCVKGPVSEKTLDDLGVELLACGVIMVIFKFDNHERLSFMRTPETNQRLTELIK